MLHSPSEVHIQFRHNENDRVGTHMYQKKRAVKCHQGLNGRHSCTTLCLNNIVRCFKWILLLASGASGLVVPVNAVHFTDWITAHLWRGLCVFRSISCSKQRQKKCFLFHLTTVSQLPLVTPTEYLQRKYYTKADIWFFHGGWYCVRWPGSVPTYTGSCHLYHDQSLWLKQSSPKRRSTSIILQGVPTQTTAFMKLEF